MRLEVWILIIVIVVSSVLTVPMIKEQEKFEGMSDMVQKAKAELTGGNTKPKIVIASGDIDAVTVTADEASDKHSQSWWGGTHSLRKKVAPMFFVAGGVRIVGSPVFITGVGKTKAEAYKNTDINIEKFRASLEAELAQMGLLR